MWETNNEGWKEISLVLISYSITDGHIEPRYAAEKSVLVNSVTNINHSIPFPKSPREY